MTKGTKSMRVQYEQAFSGKPIPKAEGQAWALAASASIREQQERREQIRMMARRPRDGEDSPSMKFAMRAIDYQIVRALWVLEISLPSDGPHDARRNGLEYMREREDHYAAGEWQHGPSRPPVPSNREIELAKQAVSWIDCLDEMQARLYRVAAQTKRGDRERKVNWERVKDRLPEIAGLKLPALQERYRKALRWIVADLTIKRLAR